MANYTAPGVYDLEQDNTGYIPALVDNICAMVTPAGKGPIGTATLSTTIDEWTNMYGQVQEQFPGSLLARDYFAKGATQLWTVRAAHSDASVATATVPLVNSTTWTVESKDMGDEYNKDILEFTYNQPVTKTTTNPLSLIVSGTQTKTIALSGGNPIVPKTVVLKVASAAMATDDGNGNLVFVSGYTGYSGTVNYATGVVTLIILNIATIATVTVTASASVYQNFTMNVVENVVNAAGTILGTKIVETISGINTTNSSALLSTSNYVDVLVTDANLAAFPVITANYQFSGGNSGLDNLVDTDIVGNNIGGDPNGLECFANPNTININTLVVPGYSSHALVREAMIDLCTNDRSDTFPVFGCNSNDTVESMVDLANGTGTYAGYGLLDTNRGAMYGPWTITLDPTSGDYAATPPEVTVLAAMAAGHYYDSPAGYDFKPPNCTGVMLEISPGDLGYLYDNRINTIGDMEGLGIMINGQKTATLTPSALDRVPNRVILNRLEKALKKAMYIYLFKANNAALWKKVTLAIQPTLDALVPSVLPYAQFICNAQTTTPALQVQDIMACFVELQLPSYAEAIILAFTLNRLDQTISTNYTTTSGVQLA